MSKLLLSGTKIKSLILYFGNTVEHPCSIVFTFVDKKLLKDSLEKLFKTNIPEFPTENLNKNLLQKFKIILLVLLCRNTQDFCFNWFLKYIT